MHQNVIVLMISPEFLMEEKTQKEVHPQAKEYFEKGIAALRKDNLDYASKLFEQFGLVASRM